MRLEVNMRRISHTQHSDGRNAYYFLRRRLIFSRAHLIEMKPRKVVEGDRERDCGKKGIRKAITGAKLENVETLKTNGTPNVNSI